MSKITINVVLQLLKLAISLISKVIRIIYTIMDIVDDGCVNASVVRPDWMISLQSVLTTLQNITSPLNSIQDEVFIESK